MRPLPDLQREMFRAITGSHDHTGATVAEVAVLEEICGDERLSTVGRLDVYARMYCARLIDALREDYPRVAAVLGPETFADVAHAYIAAHPSTHPSLRWLGSRFSGFLARGVPIKAPPFLADLARLEWARLAVFDASDAAVLDLDALRGLLPDEWATLRLRPIPAVETLAVAWPVHRIWDAVGRDAPTSEFGPDATLLRVWRQNDQVFQTAMDGAEQTAWAAVRSDVTFGELCERLAAVVSVESAAPTAGALTLRWLEDGVLAALPDR